MGYAKIEDCEVVERCSEEAHIMLLKELAAIRPDNRDGHDPRVSRAIAQLAEMGVPGYVVPCQFCGNPKGAGRHDVGQPHGVVLEWCCSHVELFTAKVALCRIRKAITELIGPQGGVLLNFDKILEEAGVSCHTDL
jgi:hypothetical protein